jgi:hypothetical protein
MQSILYLLHGNSDEETKDFFYIQLIDILSELTGEEVKLGKIENSFLLEQKFISICQVKFENKEIMNKKMVSAKGKELNRNIMKFHNFITIIVVNY